jgi:hypothetical protein
LPRSRHYFDSIFPRTFHLASMSFQNYEAFQGQSTGEQPGASGGPPQSQQPDLGQPMDNGNGGMSAGGMGTPGGAGQDGGDAKTTLW